MACDESNRGNAEFLGVREKIALAIAGGDPDCWRWWTNEADAILALFEDTIKDAARYRWLRGQQDEIVVGTNPGSFDYGMTVATGTYETWLEGDSMDAAIDAAMGAE